MVRRCRLLTAALTAVVVGLVPYTSSAAPPGKPPTGATPVDREKGGSASTVTLVTGDKVTIKPAGKSWDVQVERVRTLARQTGGFFRQVTADQVTVIPLSVLHLVRSGVLDRALFDVTGLVRQKLDDAHTREIPLLVKTAGTRKAASFGRVTRQLPSANLSAVAVPKAGLSGAAGRKAVAPLELATLKPGTKIWLNGRAKPLLDASVPQVGAPAAWKAGHTGAGVKIAVLDTGYDTKYPDLAGVVKTTKDFVGDGIGDVIGHGTHVASIAAGRGTASQGKYTGVAKGAEVMVGKVCDTDDCPYDAIIAGMQWAAASGAKVVNLSLGGGASDGTDPLSVELNRLTKETGTLFVVAAGNTGPKGRVTSPAAADAALAVGSVTKQDELSSFSSVGPRIGDNALKPELAAPGSDIVAARAAGTFPDQAVGEHYAKLSGTSMATPHVAGAAAILAGAHPDWKAAELKAALMASAKPIDAGVFEQGSGRLDVARALAQAVTTTPSGVSFKTVEWPSTGAPEQTRTITYRNVGDQPISLTLTVDARDAEGKPVDAFRLSAQTVTVPAKGTADVTLTVAPGGMAAGTYGARVVASTADQATIVQTTAGIEIEPESYDLTVQLVDRAGETLPAGSSFGEIMLLDLDDQSKIRFLKPGTKVRIPVGRYAVFAYVASPLPGQVTPNVTVGAVPEFRLEADRELRIDARAGRRTQVQVDRADARQIAGFVGMTIKRENFLSGLSIALLPEHYVIPVRGGDDFSYFTRAQYERPLVGLVEEPELKVEWTPDTAAFVGRRSFDTVDVGRARPEDLDGKDLTGKLALFTLKAADGDVFDESVGRLQQAGAAAVLFYLSERIELTSAETAIPSMVVDDPTGARLAGRKLTVEGKPASPYRYEVAIPEPGRIPEDAMYRLRDHQLATVTAKYHSPLPGAFGYIDHSIRAGRIDMTGGLWSEQVKPPLQRTEYYSPVEWSSSLRIAQGGDGSPEQGLAAAARTYRPGERLSVDWNKPVHGPGFGAVEIRDEERPLQAYREGDKLDVLVPLFTDSANHTGLARPEDHSLADKGETALYAEDGRLIGKTDSPDTGVFTVPAGPGRYRLTAEVRRDHPSWPLATRVTADWTFRSSTTDKPTALPLLAVRLDPGVDLSGNAPGGRKFAIPVSVPGGKLKKVEVSYDDGKTWAEAGLRSKGRGWIATVQHPASGFVSVRSTAVDAEGNQVVQATYRAYRLK